MAGGYDVTPVEPLDVLREELRGVKARLSELERPSGTQLYESLRNPVTPAASVGSATSFNTTTSQSSIITLSFDVPEGFSRALMFGTGSVTSMNQSGTQAYFYVRIIHHGNSGPQQNIVIQDVNTSPYADILENVSCAHVFMATGLSGGTVSSQLTTRSSAGTFGTSSFNNATLSSQVLFLR